MDSAAVMRWVDEYERAWRSGDVEAVPVLFTEDARYRRSPYEPSQIGHQAIQGFWAEDEGEVFTLSALPVAVEYDAAVVRLDVAYGDPVRQEYRDLWVLHFAADGRVDSFEEWPFWPGKPYTSPAAG